MAKGGRRPGAGRKKGYRAPQTLEKEEARARLRARVIADLEPLLDAQLANAKGIKYLVVRDKRTGKFLRVTQAMARAKQDDTEEIIEVWEKDPSVHAFVDLMNRTLDRPAEHIEMTGAGGGPMTFQWLS